MNLEVVSLGAADRQRRCAVAAAALIFAAQAIVENVRAA